MEFFQYWHEIKAGFKKSFGLGVKFVAGYLILWFISGLTTHYIFGWLIGRLSERGMQIMQPFLTISKWISDHPVGFSGILLACFCGIVLIRVISGSNEKRIKEKPYMWPIIFMVLGILSFGIGVIWFHVQQTKSVEKLKILATQPIPPPSPINPPQPQVDTDIYNITKAQAQLDLFRRIKPQLQSQKEQLEQFNKEIEPNYITAQGPNLVRQSQYLAQTTAISKFVQNNLNISIGFGEIDKQFDLNRPLREEEQIADIQDKYAYRKSHYIYLSDMHTIETLISRLDNLILQNERLIGEYAKKTLRSPQ
ncbi:MAG: hypothetical protein ABSG91_25495 [Syntrophobacteraceae bacterium]|jgi:hypothetical protein